MCGVCAIVAPGHPNLQERIAEMVSLTRHRGPDADGVLIEPIDEEMTVAFGHNRLSIVDLTEHAAQPMTSADGRFVLVYNGEVYNYKEIALELESSDFYQGAFGDTAVVLAALTKWGPAALPRFNGMWAILLYDRQERTLLVSRDRFGVKPLYYFQDGRNLYFASEIKSILVAARARLTINPNVAIPYLTRGLVNFSDETLFSGIRQFAPGSYQTIDLRHPERFRCEPVRFWWHPFEKGERPVAGAVSPDEIRAVFIDAIRLRLRSDVPVGLLLSGGVDSSAILGGITALGANVGITVLSVTSDDPASNEEPFIDMMSRFAGLVPQKVNVSKDPASLLKRIDEAIWFNDGPLLGVSDIAYLRLMEAARARGIKVLLSGQGADEQLGGYNKFFYFWLMNLVRERQYLEALKTLTRSARTSRTLFEFRLSEAVRYFGPGRLSKRTFIAPRYQDRDNVDLGLRGSYVRREWIDLVKTSVPALLHYEDRMSMSQSVEVRVPFLDYRLVELLARVHPSDKFEGGWSKAIFRKAINGLIPREVQYRRDKKGFNVPEDLWMKTEFVPTAQRTFDSRMVAEDLGLVDRRRLSALYRGYLHNSGILNGRHFFRVLAFETFLQRFAPYLAEASDLRGEA